MKRMERWELICRELGRGGFLSTSAIADRLGASVATIRRDLEALEGRGRLLRVHGGAMVAGRVSSEILFETRRVSHTAEKVAIAKRAVSLVKEGDIIFLDAGTTVFELAQLLASFERLTIITYAFHIAQVLQKSEGIALILIGGSYLRESDTFVGPHTEETLRQYHASKAFLATVGIDKKLGLVNSHIQETPLKRAMAENADEVIVLADSSKLAVKGLIATVPLRDVDRIVTDSGANPEVVAEYRALGIQVDVVDLRSGAVSSTSA